METKFIPLSVPNLKGNELKYVTNAVESEWVSTAGPYVSEFEEKLAEYVGTPGAVSCQNGTSGLHIGLILSGVTHRDAVIVPTLTFIAAVNPVSYLGAMPIFMDCDDSLCMDPVKLAAYCEEECTFRNGILTEKQTGRQIKAVIVVHVFGNMADMTSIMKTAAKYNLKVLEDATEGLGTRYTEGEYKGKFAGTIGDIGVYSFNGNKIITTGGGGMIVSQDRNLLKRAKHLTTQAKSDEANFYHDEVGYNYRMTNLQAALGLAQLEQLEDFIQIKQENYEHYRNGLQEIEGLRMLPFREGTRSNYWFYAVFCEDNYYLTRDGIIKLLSDHQVQSRPVWGLIHEQAPYRNGRQYQLQRACYYWKHIVNVPCSTNLKSEDVERVLSLLRPDTFSYTLKQPI